MDGRSSVHQRDIIILDRDEYTSCTINLHGATVTSWRIRNREMIFVSRHSHFAGPWTFGPKDGFARVLSWTVDEGPARSKSGDIYAVISLSDCPYTRSLWNYKFKLYYKITLRRNSISFNIRVENPSRYSYLEFAIMQQALMRLPNISKCEVVGLKGCLYKDVKRNKTSAENNDSLTISEETDKTYFNAPKEIIFKNMVNGGSLKVTVLHSRNINLWNPWLAADQKGDNDEYQYFIGIGAGIMSNTIRMEPLSCWSDYQMFEFIEAVQSAEKSMMMKDFYDYFHGFC